MLILSKLIVYTRDVQALVPFYRDVLGLRPIGDASNAHWVQFDAGDGMGFALHHDDNPSPVANAMPVFFAPDVQTARDELVRRGAVMDEVRDQGYVVICAGRDPAGNMFQLSNRR